MSRFALRHCCISLVLLSLAMTGRPALVAQRVPAEQLQITKIDPPNWYATLPKPMLLIRGTGFSGATFTLSDAALHIDKTTISTNGHWAQVWLSRSPTRPETVQLQARRGARHVEQAYRFAPPRRANDGLAGFSSSDAMYLIMTDRFADGDLTNDGPLGHSIAASPEAAAERAKPRGWHGGDLRGIEQHLDYLQQLGVTAVWPTPVYQNHGPESYHGYHATDYYAVDEHYGSLEDLKALAAALHARGMKLVLDTVPNHVGPLHPWVEDEPAPDWFHGTLAKHTEAETHFYALIDPHAPARDRMGTTDGWFVNQLPDMNTESPAVAQYLRQNAVWWIEQTGADGLRIDTFPYVNRQFWHDFDLTLHELFPRVTEVGEVFDQDPQVASFFAGDRANTGADGTIDTMLSTPFDFPVYLTLRAVLTGEKLPMTALAEILRADSLYPHPERLVTFIGNHDTTRFLSAPGADMARLRMAFALIATLRGMPQLYYGDELAMTGGEDPANRKDMPGGFPDDAHNAFTPGGRNEAQEAMHKWVQRLLQLRLHSPALQSGYQQNLMADAGALAFVRSDRQTEDCTVAPAAERYLVVANVETQPRKLMMDTHATALAGCGHFESLLDDGPAASGDSEVLHVDVPGETVRIFRVRP